MKRTLAASAIRPLFLLPCLCLAFGFPIAQAASPSWNPPEITRKHLCEITVVGSDVARVNPGDYIRIAFGSIENRRVHSRKISDRLRLKPVADPIHTGASLYGPDQVEVIHVTQIERASRYIGLFRAIAPVKNKIQFQVLDLTHQEKVSSDEQAIEVSEHPIELHPGTSWPLSLPEELRSMWIHHAYEVHLHAQTTPHPIVVHVGDLLVTRYHHDTRESFRRSPTRIESDEAASALLQEVATKSIRGPQNKGMEIVSYFRPLHAGHVTIVQQGVDPYGSGETVWEFHQPIDILP